MSEISMSGYNNISAECYASIGKMKKKGDELLSLINEKLVPRLYEIILIHDLEYIDIITNSPPFLRFNSCGQTKISINLSEKEGGAWHDFYDYITEFKLSRHMEVVYIETIGHYKSNPGLMHMEVTSIETTGHYNHNTGFMHTEPSRTLTVSINLDNSKIIDLAREIIYNIDKYDQKEKELSHLLARARKQELTYEKYLLIEKHVS